MLTIHRSKGLEFPVVYCPFLWEPGYIAGRAAPGVLPRPRRGDARTIDVGLDGPRLRSATAQQHSSSSAARTCGWPTSRSRAPAPGHRVVGGLVRQPQLAAGRLLFARDADGNVASEGSRRADDADASTRFERARRATRRAAISVERVGARAAGALAPAPPAPRRARGGARSTATLDQRWRRTSYSDITAGAHDALRGERARGAAASTDEPDAAAGRRRVARGRRRRGGAVAAGRRCRPAPSVGTFVHRVLEATDFAAPDLDAELARRLAARRRAGASTSAIPSAVVGRAARGDRDAARAAARRPAPARLRARADRLDELDFELPLAGGDDRRAAHARGDRRAAARAPAAGDPLAGYADAARRPGAAPERARLPDRQHRPRRAPRRGDAPRFAVVDYKTNWLGAAGRAADAPGTTARRRSPRRCTRAHYALQALLYTVALHRYLRWRLPGYDPDATSPASCTCSCAG